MTTAGPRGGLVGLIQGTETIASFSLAPLTLKYYVMILLKKPNQQRCFNFPDYSTYANYAIFLENFTPCISGFLIGIIFHRWRKDRRENFLL